MKKPILSAGMTLGQMLNMARMMQVKEKESNVQKIENSPYYVFKMADGDYGVFTVEIKYPRPREHMEVTLSTGKKALADIIAMRHVQRRVRKVSIKNMKSK